MAVAKNMKLIAGPPPEDRPQPCESDIWPKIMQIIGCVLSGLVAPGFGTGRQFACERPVPSAERPRNGDCVARVSACEGRMVSDIEAWREDHGPRRSFTDAVRLHPHLGRAISIAAPHGRDNRPAVDGCKPQSLPGSGSFK